MAARDINWKTRREDGSTYEVRVHWFGKKFKLQFREKGAELWDYNRPPSREDLETLVETMKRRYQRREATILQLDEAERMLAEALDLE